MKEHRSVPLPLKPGTDDCYMCDTCLFSRVSSAAAAAGGGGDDGDETTVLAIHQQRATLAL